MFRISACTTFLVGSLCFLVPIAFLSQPASSIQSSAVIYFNYSCEPCASYAYKLKAALDEVGITDSAMKDILDKNNAFELRELRQRLGVPESMWGHLVTVVDNKFLFEGYVPINLITEFLTREKDSYQFIVIYYDGKTETYLLMNELGEIKSCQITESIVNCDQKASFLKTFSNMPMILLVAASGLIDGINPCAFAILLFFIGFLFTIRKTRVDILKVGLIYISALFTTYLFIGLGILQAVRMSGYPHLFVKIGAILLIVLGLVNVKDYFLPGKIFSLRIPRVSEKVLVKWAQKSTIPSSLILGVLVGLCEFPCTGGIYFAILGLLASNNVFAQGLFYLLLYNFMFVAPLLAILLVSSNKVIVNKLTEWRGLKKEQIKLMSGLLMMILGLLFLYARIF